MALMCLDVGQIEVSADQREVIKFQSDRNDLCPQKTAEAVVKSEAV
jgi:hypothetical protein